MTAPLDEKAIAQAHEAYAKTTGGLLEGNPMANAIRAYLSTVALPDELPVWGYHVRRLTDEGAKFSQSLRFNQEQASPTNVVTPLVSGPEARSALAALRAERDAAFTMSKCECGPDEACRNLVAASTHAETAEAEVTRLTEDNEALRKALGVADEALCDWLNTYASDMCSPVHAEAAQARLREHGTIAYIAGKLKIIRAALSGSKE